MNRSLVAFTLFLLLFSMSANALQVDAPSTIVVQESQKDIPLTIRNDTEAEQEYSVQFYAPFDAIVSPSFGRLGSGKSTISSLSIPRQEDLEGSSYEASLEVRLGEEKAFRRLRVIFKESGKGEELGSTTGADSGLVSLAGFYAFAGIFTPENLLNVFLVFVAAILLIAFIARFVKRLEGSK